MAKLKITDGPNGKFVFFWKLKHPGEELSNWFLTKFTHKGIEFNCSEQHMMWEKAELFKDYTKQKEILAETDPAKQKALGRQVKNFNQDTWESVCFNLIKEGLVQKFGQSPPLKELLLSTGTATLAEASPVDRVWGIGLADTDPDAQVVSRWRGKNLLGKVLMEVRKELQS
jgi:ribA/ribD-fused uncharacterized protein